MDGELIRESARKVAEYLLKGLEEVTYDGMKKEQIAEYSEALKNIMDVIDRTEVGRW